MKDAGIIRNGKKVNSGKTYNVLVKEGRLKRYRQRVKPYRRNRTF